MNERHQKYMILKHSLPLYILILIKIRLLCEKPRSLFENTSEQESWKTKEQQTQIMYKGVLNFKLGLLKKKKRKEKTASQPLNLWNGAIWVMWYLCCILQCCLQLLYILL